MNNARYTPKRTWGFAIRDLNLKAASFLLCMLTFAIFLFQEEWNSAVLADSAPASNSAINPSGPAIALTFDDGPYDNVTDRILDVLERHGVTATFFVLGSRIRGRESYLMRMDRLKCEVANHTFSHARLTNISASRIRDEIKKCDDEIERVLGHRASVVRPPFGFYNRTVCANIDYPLVLWTVDAEDWHYRDPWELASYVIGHAADNCIILMHDQQPTTARSMEIIIPGLIERGFRFVTVSELIDMMDGELAAIKIP